MSILIGIKDAERIRYISVDAPQDFDKIVSRLKTFYKTFESVNALIGLGNLNYLGMCPFKKSKGDFDMIHCESRIRDKKLVPSKHSYSFVDDEMQFIDKLESNPGRNLNCCFLYDNDKWYILIGDHKESLDKVDKSVLHKSKRMDGLQVFTYDSENKYDKLISHDFHSWKGIQQSADEKQIPHYVFRGEKYIHTIIPCKSKKLVENAISDNRL